MKIVLLTEFFPRDGIYFTGGVEVRVTRVYEYLKKSGHEVAVVCRSDNYNFNSPATAVKRLAFFIRLAVKIAFSRLPEADVVEGTNFTTYILAFLYAKKTKARAFAWYPDVFLGQAVDRLGFINGILTEIAERISLKLPWDRIIALSRETKNKLISAGVDRGKVSVIYGGVNIPNLPNLPKFPNPTILCIARLVKYKRIHDLILAVYLLKDRFPDINLILVGEGPEINHYKRQTANYKLQNQIEFLGRVSEEKKWDLLSKSHIHVLPSAVEGFGLATIEALSAGTPVVNADMPINREILGRNQESGIRNQVLGGLLFSLGDYVDLAEKIEILLTDKKIYGLKVKEGFELAKKYDWEKVNKEYEHLLFN